MYKDIDDISVDEVGKVIFNNLIELKQKLDVVEQKKKMWAQTTILILVCFAVYFTYFSLLPNWPSVPAMFVQLLEDRFQIFLVLLIVGSLTMIQTIDKKCSKIENEYNALRCEVIQRTEELWPRPNQWPERHKAFEFMERKYGINLYSEH